MDFTPQTSLPSPRAAARHLAALAGAFAVVVLAAGAAEAPGAAVATARPPPEAAAARASGFARLVRPAIGRLEAQIAGLELELAALPQPAHAVPGARLGWHTTLLGSGERAVWVQVDLGTRWPVDRIAVIPARTLTEAGYGFPRRFRVEISDTADFQESRPVADFSAEDFPNPGILPVVVEAGGRPARFVRVTVVKSQSGHGEGMAALGEIMVLSGPRNVAAGRAVRASSTLRSLPAWQPRNLTDGASPLGPPVSPEPSPSDGYLARKGDDADTEKWVQIDLRQPRPIDEVRIFPARPLDLADRPGHGFPVRFRVEVSDDPSFSERRALLDATAADFENPADFPVNIPGGGAAGRFLRITASRQYDRVRWPTFALAEVQVWSGGDNVALGAPVAALDEADRGQSRWSPAALVDGFNSRSRILGYDEWLAGLNRAREIGLQLARLRRESDALAAGVARWTERAALAGGGLFLIGAVALILRSRRERRRAVGELRGRISRDLHDEIGSNLGSIALLSEAAGRQTADAAARIDFAEIRRISGRTNEALREIVWLLGPAAQTRAELAARMRDHAPELLGDIRVEFDCPAAFRQDACSLEFSRNIWLIFKEAAHNIAKHAHARHVAIRITEPGGGFELRLRDDGCGFSADCVAPGHGLANLRRRAEQLGATFHIATAPGTGTEVRLLVPR